MLPDGHLAPLAAEDTQRLENVLNDSNLSGTTRRQLLVRAAATTAALSAIGPAAASAATSGDSPNTLTNQATTIEALAVTLLTALLKNPPAGVSKFADILKANITAEYDHYEALSVIGGRSKTDRFWIPDAYFEPANVFPTLEIAETLFVNLYLIATTVFTNHGSPTNARYAAEIAGVEAQHRVLTRFAQNKLPNNVGFGGYQLRSMSGIINAIQQTGVGLGTRGTKPGRYYTFAPPPADLTIHLTTSTPT